MKIPKLLFILLVILSFLAENSGVGYALRPMAAKHTEKASIQIGSQNHNFTQRSGQIFVPDVTIIIPKFKDPFLHSTQERLSLCISAINGIQKTTDVHSYEAQNLMDGYLRDIIELSGLVNVDSLRKSLSPKPFFTILQGSRQPMVRERVYKILNILGEEFIRKIVEPLTHNLSGMDENSFYYYLKLLDLLPRYYDKGLPGLPDSMTFGIELEVALVDDNLKTDKDNNTDKLYSALTDFMRANGLLERGWVIKRDQIYNAEDGTILYQTIEIATKDGGLANTEEGWSELKEGLSKIADFIRKFKPESSVLRQGLHIHVGNPRPNDKQVIYAMSYVGKSMEGLWSWLSETGSIIKFQEEALRGSSWNAKNHTPFYYDESTETIAFNIFAPPHLNLLENRRYFDRLQLTISTAMNIVYNIGGRPDEFNPFTTGLPLLEGFIYTPRNAYLLRRHLFHLFKDNCPGLIAALQLLIDRKRLPALVISEELAGPDKKRLERLYLYCGLYDLYRMHDENNGWDNAIKEHICDYLSGDALGLDWLMFIETAATYYPDYMRTSGMTDRIIKMIKEERCPDIFVGLLRRELTTDHRIRLDSPVSCIAFSPDSNFIIVGSGKYTHLLYGQELYYIRNYGLEPSDVIAVEFHGNNMFSVVHQNGRCHLCSTEKGGSLFPFNASLEGYNATDSYRPFIFNDMTVFIDKNPRPSVKIWDLSTLRLKHNFMPSKARFYKIRHIARSHDQKKLLIAMVENSLSAHGKKRPRLVEYNLATRRLKEIKGFPKDIFIKYASYSFDRRYIFLVTDKGKLMQFDTKKGALEMLVDDEGGVEAVEPLPSGRTGAICHTNPFFCSSDRHIFAKIMEDNKVYFKFSYRHILSRAGIDIDSILGKTPKPAARKTPHGKNVILGLIRASA